MTYTEETHRKLITDIYQQYSCDVKYYFMKYTRDEMAAEDMVQELFIKLMNYEDMIVGQTAKSFVFTIAKRMVVDDARHKAFVRRATKGYELEAEQNRFWQDNETLECKQLREMELRIVSMLPKKMAQVYRLTRYEEKTADELAQELGISKRTVEYHLLMSRKQVRKAMRKAVNM